MRALSLTLIIALLLASPASLAMRADSSCCCPLMGKSCPLRAKSCAKECGMRRADHPIAVAAQITFLPPVVFPTRIASPAPQGVETRVARIEPTHSQTKRATDSPPPKRA